KKYPNGQFADLAQARIARLTGATEKLPAAAAAAASRPASVTAARDDGEVQRLMTLAEKGNAPAMSQLAYLYQYGYKGVAKDPTRAVQLYQRALADGDPAAPAGLGFMLHHGYGGLQADPVKAVELYRKGAELGNGRAMNNLGAAYADGAGGLPKDDAQA